MILKKRGGKKRLRGRQCQKAAAVVWQWVSTFKEAVPPPHSGTTPLAFPFLASPIFWSYLFLPVPRFRSVLHLYISQHHCPIDNPD